MNGFYDNALVDAAAEALRELTQNNQDAAKEALRIRQQIANGINWRDL